MQDNSFDNNIRHELEGFGIEPSPKVWTGVEKELDRKKRRYFFVWWLLPLLFIGGGAIWYAGIQKNSKDFESKQVAQTSSPKTENNASTINQPTSAIQPVTVTEQPGNNMLTGNEKEDNNNTVRSATKSNAGKTKMQITTAGTDRDDERIAAGINNKKQVSGKTSISIKPAATGEDVLQDAEQASSETNTVAVVVNDNSNTITDSAAIATTTKTSDKVEKTNVNDSLATNTVEKETKKSPSKWVKQWVVGGGYAGLGTLKIGAANSEVVFNNNGGTAVPGTGSSYRESNKYSFNNGVYLNAGMLISLKLSDRTSLTTGLQYNFQHINVTRKYMLDSLTFTGTPSYANINSINFKESLNIHAIDIPLLVNFSLSKRINLSTGIFNRFQFTNQWKKYEDVLGVKKTYLPLFHFNPAYNFKNFSLGPVVNIGLTEYNNGSRLMNVGLSFKYSPKK